MKALLTEASAVGLSSPAGSGGEVVLAAEGERRLSEFARLSASDAPAPVPGGEPGEVALRVDVTRYASAASATPLGSMPVYLRRDDVFALMGSLLNAVKSWERMAEHYERLSDPEYAARLRAKPSAEERARWYEESRAVRREMREEGEE